MNCRISQRILHWSEKIKLRFPRGAEFEGVLNARVENAAGVFRREYE
jgi:hypothetical protein